MENIGATAMKEPHNSFIMKSQSWEGKQKLHLKCFMPKRILKNTITCLILLDGNNPVVCVNTKL